jgi:putative nucleotidyltransferase with HDIG domain
MSRREEILARIRSIPAMPAGAFRVLSLVQNPDVDMAILTRAIEFDPGLTSNLLKVANSAFFGCPRSVGSVREAIVRLGMNNLRRMLGPLAVAPIVRRPVKGYDLPAGALMEHSVAVAVGAEALQKALKMESPKETFTAALLHDIGKILLGTFVEVDAAEIRRIAFEGGLSFEIAEDKVLGIDHAEAGAALLESWNCPKEIAEVARWHHEPEACPTPNPVVSLVHISDAISMMQGIGTGADGLNYRMSEGVVDRWKLTGEIVEAVACRMLGELEEMRDAFDKATSPSPTNG